MSNRVDSLSVWRMYDFSASYMGLHSAFLSLKRCDLKVRNEAISKWDRRLTTDAGDARVIRTVQKVLNAPLEDLRCTMLRQLREDWLAEAH